MDPPVSEPFRFPQAYRHPAMWTIQKVIATREEQYKRWSRIIQLYCRHYRMWKLKLNEALTTPLFWNIESNKRLNLQEARGIVDWMTRDEGLKRAEWASSVGESNVAWIYWRSLDEWAELISHWVEAL